MVVYPYPCRNRIVYAEAISPEWGVMESMQASRILRYSGLGLLLTVLAVGPFFRGLFFWTELLAAIVAISVGFVLWLIGRRLGGLPTGIPGGATGIALLALLGCYLIQFAWAVYPRGNLDWVLRVAAAWMAYVMMRAESGPSLRRWLGWLFVLSASGVAAMGFLEYAGFFAKNAELVGALNLVNLGDRMYTPLQYPNTAAAYLLTAVFAALGLALEELRPWKAGLLTGIMTLLSLAFFFTLSRGAMVVLPFGLIALFVGIERSKLTAAVLLLASAWVPVLAVVRYIGPAAAAHQVGAVLGWILAASGVGLFAGIISPRLLRLKVRARRGVLVSALVVAMGGLVLLASKGELVPAQASRLLDLNLRTQNAVYRFTLFDDAWRMIRDKPLGRGGWGWDRTYRQYQTTYYVGQETHNHYLQTAVEAGAVGLIALGVAMLAAIWAVWRNQKAGSLPWSLAAGAILIAGHSVIEFNLSFGLVWLLFWVLLASGGQPLVEGRREVVSSWGALVASTGMAGLTAMLLTGSWFVNQAEEALAAENPQDAVSLAQTATRYDPENSAPLLIVGSRAALEKAVQLDPYAARPHSELSILLQNEGDWEGALKEARAAVANAPLNNIYLNRLVSVAGKAMVDRLHSGERGRARELAQDLVSLGDAVEKHRNVAGPWMQPKPSLNPESKLRYGQALFLTGKEKDAETLLREVAKVGLLGSEADVWLYAIYERRGDAAEKEKLKEKPWIRFLSINPVYKVIVAWL